MEPPGTSPQMEKQGEEEGKKLQEEVIGFLQVESVSNRQRVQSSRRVFIRQLMVHSK